MGTITEPTPVMWDIVDAYEAEFPSAVFSGINGDAAHQTSPGKHLSRSQNKDKFGSNCWPLQAPNDQKGPTDKAIAVDISMNRADQNRCHNNFIKVYNNRKNDPRSKYIYAFNGWNGSGSPYRYNLYNGSKGPTDNTHTWHEHQEGYYAFVNDPEFVRATQSAFKGETIDEYQGDDVGTVEGFTAEGARQFKELIETGLHEAWLGSTGPSAATALQSGYLNTVNLVTSVGEVDEQVAAILAPRFEEVIAAIVADDSNPISLDPEQITELANQIAGQLPPPPTAEQIADAVVSKLDQTGLTEGQEADVKAATKAAYTEVVLQGVSPDA